MSTKYSYTQGKTCPVVLDDGSVCGRNIGDKAETCQKHIRSVLRGALTYEQKRNALIPEAERYANKATMSVPVSTDEYNEKWTLAFYTRMNERAREAGLV